MAERIGDPDRAFGIEADAVGVAALDLRPGAPVRERAVGCDVEGRQPMRERLADDQRLAIGRDHRAVGEQQVVGGFRRLAVGIDPHDAGRALCLAAMAVEPEIADPGPPVAIDHHVVAWAGRQRCSSDLSPGSQAQALAALRSFLSWSRTLGTHRLSGDVISTALKTPKAVVRRPYRTLREPGIAAVLASAFTTRDRALLAVLLGGGLRAVEVVGLDVTDLHDDPDGGIVIGPARQGAPRPAGPRPAGGVQPAPRLSR